LKSEPGRRVKRKWSGKVKAEKVRDLPSRQLRMRRHSAVKCEVKSEPCTGDGREAWKWVKQDPCTTFAARLPLFIAQCQAFQAAKRTWAPARPCCLANRFIQPLAAPSREGKSCYQRLTKVQRQHFREYVENVEARGRIKDQRGNHHFLTLLHPEKLHKRISKKSGLPREKVRFTPLEMKKWPWMRDLDVRWWIGNGWLLTADGPKRAVETSSAPGTEVFQGCGQRTSSPLGGSLGKESLQHSSPSGTEALPLDAPARYASAAMGAVARGEGQKRVIRVSGKSSGVRNVIWDEEGMRWRVSWMESGKRILQDFFQRKYIKLGKSAQEANAEALHDALAFREDLVKRGKIKAATSIHQSRVKGVFWTAGNKSWVVKIRVRGKLLHGGSFRPKDDTAEAMEEARLAAIECRRKLEAQHFEFDVKEVQNVGPVVTKRSSGAVGVSWNTCRQSWDVRICLKGGERYRRCFHPKDFTPEEVERARLAAVQCRQDLERQKAAPV